MQGLILIINHWLSFRPSNWTLFVDYQINLRREHCIAIAWWGVQQQTALAILISAENLIQLKVLERPFCQPRATLDLYYAGSLGFSSCMEARQREQKPVFSLFDTDIM